MELEIKKDLASNWFKIFRMHFVMIFINLEKNKIQFKSYIGKEI